MHQLDWAKGVLLEDICKMLPSWWHAVITEHTHFCLSLQEQIPLVSLIAVTSRHSTKPPSQLAAAFQRTSVEKPRNDWHGSSFLEVVSPQGQSTARKPLFPALCAHCTQMTSRSEAACKAPPPAVIPAEGTNWLLITKIIRLHLQCSSQHCLWSGNQSPRLFHCMRRVQPWFPGRGDRIEGSSACLGRSDMGLSSAFGLPYLCREGAGKLTKGSACSLSYDTDWQPLLRKWPRNVATHRGNCCFTHASAKELMPSSFPPHWVPRLQEDKTQQIKQKLSYLLSLLAGTNYVSRQQSKTQRR